jgi:cation diffusion facilitator family transporter
LSAAARTGQRQTALVSLAAAGVLVVLKLGTGLATGSLALTSAGIESSGDVIAALLTLLAVSIGARPADEDHPYGHRRAENLAAMAEAVIISVGGTVITYEAIRQLSTGHGEGVDTGWYVFAVIAVALAIDVSRIVVSLRAANRYDSPAFRSNAYNFAGDLAGSLAALVGLVLVAAGVASGDAIAALVVAGLIFAAVTRLLMQNASSLMDRAPAEARARAEEAIRSIGVPVEVRRLRLRESAGRYFSDVVIEAPPAAAVVESHDLADRVEAAIQEALPGSDVVVHVEPRDRGVALRERVLAAALLDPEVREAHDIAIFRADGGAIVTLHLKLADDPTLAAAHAVAERVEEAIRALPDVKEVQTHLEPLERPMAVRGGSRETPDSRAGRIRRLARDQIGREPTSVEVIDSEAGPVALLGVGLDPDVGLRDAHELAGKLETAIRAELPDLVDVVVHTEPSRAPGAPPEG